MRLLLSDEWFDAVASEGQYESEFEAVIRSRAQSLFPQFHVVPFRMAVESEDGRRIPDLALVDLSYRFWWVVEVEMAHHSLYRHVLPQVSAFAGGRYGVEHADYLARNSDDLDKVALQDMVLGAQPRVIVVVNRNVPDWIEPIRRFDALVTVVEIFRSGRNQHILRVNGDYPYAEDAQIVSMCRLDKNIPNLVQIDSPAGLGIVSGEQIEIDFNGGLTNWSRLDTSDRVWLVPTGRNPLEAGKEYHLLRDTDRSLSFRTRI